MELELTEEQRMLGDAVRSLLDKRYDANTRLAALESPETINRELWQQFAELGLLGLTFEEVPIGFPALKAHGTTLPDSSFEAGKRADGVILGPVSHNDYPPVAQGGLNPSGEMRKRLDLYANIRPAKSRPGMPPRGGAVGRGP